MLRCSRSVHKGPGGRQPAVLALNACSGPAHDILLMAACAERACAVSGWPHQSTASNVAACWHLLDCRPCVTRRAGGRSGDAAASCASTAVGQGTGFPPAVTAASCLVASGDSKAQHLAAANKLSLIEGAGQRLQGQTAQTESAQERPAVRTSAAMSHLACPPARLPGVASQGQRPPSKACCPAPQPDTHMEKHMCTLESAAVRPTYLQERGASLAPGRPATSLSWASCLHKEVCSAVQVQRPQQRFQLRPVQTALIPMPHQMRNC